MPTFANHVHFLTTPRYLTGGAGHNNYANFNLATYVSDDSDAVAHNRALLIRHFQLPDAPKYLTQVHGDTCLELTHSSTPGEADVAFTREPNVVLAVLTADCLPIFVSNQAGTLVGIIHAGYQGILAGVIAAAIKHFNEDPSSLIIHFGPAISQSALALDVNMYQQFISKDARYQPYFLKQGDQYHLDIFAIARFILNQCGVVAINQSQRCTYHLAQQYFSYRRQGPESGRMANLIWFI